MANMMDYLDWRGDLTFQQAPFNEVDNLLLTELVYVDFTGIVPAPGFNGAVFLKDASRLFWERHTDQEILERVSMTKSAPFVMRKMAESRRFENICLSSYVREIDAEMQSQFSAVCCVMDDQSLFVAYSGTDSTIVGWRENFNMTYLEHIPGQEKAVRYLEEAVRDTHQTVRIGGHSKGGNLAVYAGVFCNESVREKILEVYSNDGPGFAEGVLSCGAYKELLPRIRRVLPQRAVVGMLLGHRAEYEVVHSTENYTKQHDMLSWEVLGPAMVCEDHLSEHSIMIDEILKTWVSAMDIYQRQRFVETIFTMLDNAGVKSVDDLFHMKWRSVSEFIRTQRELSEEEKEILSRTWKMLVGAGSGKLRKTIQDKRRQEKEKVSEMKKAVETRKAVETKKAVIKKERSLK